eukprot:6873638-Prymnesium_polylepis.1
MLVHALAHREAPEHGGSRVGVALSDWHGGRRWQEGPQELGRAVRLACSRPPHDASLQVAQPHRYLEHLLLLVVRHLRDDPVAILERGVCWPAPAEARPFCHAVEDANDEEAVRVSLPPDLQIPAFDLYRRCLPCSQTDAQLVALRAHHVGAQRGDDLIVREHDEHAPLVLTLDPSSQLGRASPPSLPSVAPPLAMNRWGCRRHPIRSPP